MHLHDTLLTTLSACLLLLSATLHADEVSPLQGSWRMLSYFNAADQRRYATEGYMMFGQSQWLHVVYFNRDERAKDFAEAHHGTYQITSAATLDLRVDMDMHMDPKREFQQTDIWYGPVDEIVGAGFKREANRLTIDLPSTAQIVLERIE